MSTYFSISASNVTFTESYNYGIVKAGDAGSGARGRDGVGGSDTSNNTMPPGYGTSGQSTEKTDSEGNVMLDDEENNILIGSNTGHTGKAYIYGTTPTADGFTPKVDLMGGIGGTDGSPGNDGYGGVNFYKYDAGERHGYVGTNPNNKTLLNVEFSVYSNPTSLGQDSKNYSYYIRVRYGMYEHAGNNQEGTGIYIRNDCFEFLTTYSFWGYNRWYDGSYSEGTHANGTIIYSIQGTGRNFADAFGAPYGFSYDVHMQFYVGDDPLDAECFAPA